MSARPSMQTTIEAQTNLIVFPLSKNRRKVRQVADALARKQGRAAETYWSERVVKPIAERLERIGVPLDVVQAELQQFTDAVATQMSLETRTYRRPVE